MRLPGFCVSVFFSLLSLTRGQIDRSICVPVSNISDASPIPALSESYSTTVEWKLLHNNSTISIDEYVIGMEKLSSIRITQEGHTSRIIYDEANQHSPIPALSESYSTTVEWKLLHNNSTISIDEYVIGMEKLSSIRITQEGHTSRIIYDEANQQYTMLDIVNNQCTTQNYVLDVVLFGNEIWKSTTKQLYQILKQSITSWSTCVYLLEYNVTLSATIYFAAEGWPMPFAAPNAMVPVRLELRGSYNNNQTRFHAVGDYVNFLPTPPTNLDNVQIEPGMFCAGRDVGMPILPVPTDFSTVIERVNIHDKQVTYETIWFDSRRKFVRYETKSAGGDDVDPTRIVFDFYDGVRYSIDPYTSSCDPPTIIERGDKFVDQTASPITRIQMQSSLDFFKLQNATVQYEGWQEGIGTSITPGSLVRFDVWAANSNFPIIHNVHKLNPSQPYLTAFEIGPCFTGPHKRNFVIKFATSGLDLSQVSLNYIRDQIQEILTTQAQLDNLRFSNVAFENFGANDWYFTATLLDKSPVDNNNIFPPVLMKEPLNSAFGFLTGYVDTPWVYNITQPTLPTTTGTFLVPTLPVQTTGTSVTTAMPTPPAPPTGPTVKVTTQTTSPTTKLTTSNRSGGAVGIALACLAIGAIVGAIVMFVIQKKFPNGFRNRDGYLNPVFDDSSRY
uniref:LolA-like domain-containing protein n=1 Tax=Magallana gigas TaxID=29159 RepID=K1R2X6_MAGGI